MGRRSTAFHVSCINIVVNILLAVMKLSVGVLSGSHALLSDGVHSVTDVLSSTVVLIGIKLSAKHSDGKHPYGHERMECVAAVLLSVLIAVTGVGIGVSGVRMWLNSVGDSCASHGGLAMATSCIAIAAKEGMFRYTRRAAIKWDSAALLADAWHARSDALSSLGSFVGVLGARMGFAYFDSVAAVLIGVLIVKAAVSIFSDAMTKMTDRSCEEPLQSAIHNCVLLCDGVQAVRELKTRLFGNRVFVETTVDVSGELSCRQAFEVARRTAHAVCERFEQVKECAVHIHPL